MTKSSSYTKSNPRSSSPLPTLKQSHSLQHLNSSGKKSHNYLNRSQPNHKHRGMGHQRGRSLSFDPNKNRHKLRNNFGRSSFHGSTHKKKRSHNHRDSEARSRSSTLLNSNQIELIHTMIRSTILTAFCIISTIILLFFINC